MNRLFDIIRRYALWFIVGCVLHALASDYAADARGYNAFGGEILVFPLIMLIALMFNRIRQDVKDHFM